MVQGVTPAHKGLSPSRLIRIFIRKGAHAGHTQSIKCSCRLNAATPFMRTVGGNKTKKNQNERNQDEL